MPNDRISGSIVSQQKGDFGGCLHTSTTVLLQKHLQVTTMG